MTVSASISLDGLSLTLEHALAIALGKKVSLSSEAQLRVDASRKLVEDIVQGEAAVYGINTGFGYFANTRIAPEELRRLQDNIVLSHAGGWGDALSIPQTRLAMALRLNVLARGHTGVRWKLCCALRDLINEEIYPIIPKHGSVGASGDLAPLAHLALPITGRGDVIYRGQRIPATEALAKAGLEPLHLAEKEGLGLINGTQVMLAVGTLAFRRAQHLVEIADLITALSYEAMVAHTSPLDARLHELRGQSGQEISAKVIRGYLEGSYLYNSNTSREKVQDPYSLRCAPQVHGPTRDALEYVGGIITRELNAVTDNPLLFPDSGDSVSGGNFHGQALAMAYDFTAIATAELGSISERRLELLLNPYHSKLNAFLAPKEGLDSGYMTGQYLSASLVNANKLLANPACTDSIPGNVGVEDHVSMGMTSARKLDELVDNAVTILAVEAVCAAQAIDLRGVGPLGKGSQRLYDAIRNVVPTMTEDRIIAEDFAAAREVLTNISE